jgi:hypothetical protein
MDLLKEALEPRWVTVQITPAASVRVGGVLPRGKVGQRPFFEFGDGLLDDRVVAVAIVGLDHAQRAVGDERVVAVGGEQFALPDSVRCPPLAEEVFPFRNRARAITGGRSGVETVAS